MKAFYTLPIIFLFLIQTAFAQELRDMIEQASEHYNTGNCSDVLGLVDEIFAAEPAELKSRRDIIYTLSYYGGTCARQLGEHERVVEHLARALNNNPNAAQVPVLFTMLANAEEALGSYRLARQHYAQAAEMLPDGEDKASLYYLLAELYRKSGIYKEALVYCDNATRLAKQAGNIQVELACISSTGEVYYEEEDYPRAIRTFSQGITLARSAQRPLEMANNHTGLGIVYEALQRYDFARTNYNDAIRFYMLTLNFTNIPMLSGRLVNIPATKEEAEESIKLYQELANELKVMDSEIEIYAQRLLGANYIMADNQSAALDIYNTVLGGAVAADMPEMAFEAASKIARIQFNMKNLDGAIATLDEAAKYQTTQNPPRYLAGIYGLQGDIFLEMESPTMAAYSYRKAYDNAINTEEKNKYLKLLATLDPSQTGGGI